MRLNPTILATAVAFISSLEDLVAAYNNDILQSELTDSTTNPDILQNDISDAEQVATEDRPYHKRHATGKRHVPVTFSDKDDSVSDETSDTKSHHDKDDTPSESEINEYLNSLHSTYGSAMDGIFTGLEDSVDIFSTGDDADDSKNPLDTTNLVNWLNELMMQASSGDDSDGSDYPLNSPDLIKWLNDEKMQPSSDEDIVDDPHPVKWRSIDRDHNSWSFVDAPSGNKERSTATSVDEARAGSRRLVQMDVEDDGGYADGPGDRERRLIQDYPESELDPEVMDVEDVAEMLQQIQKSVNVLNLKADHFIELSKEDGPSGDMPKNIKNVIQDPLESLKRQTKSVQLSTTGSDQGKFEALLQDIQISADALESKTDALMKLTGDTDISVDDKHVYSFKKPIADPLNVRTDSIYGYSSDSGSDYDSVVDFEVYRKNHKSGPFDSKTNDLADLDERSEDDYDERSDPALDPMSTQPVDPLNGDTKSSGSNQGLDGLLDGLKTSGAALQDKTASLMGLMGVSNTTGADLVSGLKQSVTDPLNNMKNDVLNSTWANPIDTMKENVKNSITDPLNAVGLANPIDTVKDSVKNPITLDGLLNDAMKPGSSDSDSGSDGFEDFLSSLFDKEPKDTKGGPTSDEDLDALMGLDEDDAVPPTGAGALAAATAPTSAPASAPAPSSAGSGSNVPKECTGWWTRTVSWLSNMGQKKHICTVPQ